MRIEYLTYDYFKLRGVESSVIVTREFCKNTVLSLVSLKLDFFLSDFFATARCSLFDYMFQCMCFKYYHGGWSCSCRPVYN